MEKESYEEEVQPYQNTDYKPIIYNYVIIVQSIPNNDITMLLNIQVKANIFTCFKLLPFSTPTHTNNIPSSGCPDDLDPELS